MPLPPPAADTPAGGHDAGAGGAIEAAALGAAMAAASVISLASTLVFTRLLGSDGYGSLAALLNLSVILYVPGGALQIAVARAGALGRLGGPSEMAATLARWAREVVAAVAVVAVVAAVARRPLAAVLGIDEAWAAAAVPVTAGLWLLVSVQRGMLQARRGYRAVGASLVLEAAGRLGIGVVLTVAGLGVTGAYVATLGSLLAAAAVLGVMLRRRLGPPAPRAARHPLGGIAGATIVPIAALTCLGVLQNVDVIVARHVLADDPAGAYAAATVAAKALVWIAIGIGLWVLPEAVRRVAAGADARGILLRAFAVIGAIAAPALVFFALAPGLVMRVAFGAEFEEGRRVLPVLGVAYALLALGYVAVQFLLGLGRRSFLVVLGVAALAQPALLAVTSSPPGLAWVVLGVQSATAVALVASALRRAEGPRAGARRPPAAGPPAVAAPG